MQTQKIISRCTLLATALCLVGCSNNSTTTDNPGNPTSNETNAIKIEDIAWNVEEGIVDGDRFVLLDYTNNTPYTITGFELTFTEKPDITEEEKTTFYTEIQTDFELSDEDIEDLKSQPISMHAESDVLVDAIQSITNVNCYYFAGIYYLKNINHYNLVVPDIATIRYIDGDNIHTVYYDYNSKKYSEEADTEPAYQWSQTDLGNMVPKPDAKVVETNYDNENAFSFNVLGFTSEKFNAYVEECKGLGFTVDPNISDGFYSADNAEGYNVRVNCYDYDHYMGVSISMPDTE